MTYFTSVGSRCATTAHGPSHRAHGYSIATPAPGGNNPPAPDRIPITNSVDYPTPGSFSPIPCQAGPQWTMGAIPSTPVEAIGIGCRMAPGSGYSNFRPGSECECLQLPRHGSQRTGTSVQTRLRGCFVIYLGHGGVAWCCAVAGQRVRATRCHISF